MTGPRLDHDCDCCGYPTNAQPDVDGDRLCSVCKLDVCSGCKRHEPTQGHSEGCNHWTPVGTEVSQ